MLEKTIKQELVGKIRKQYRMAIGEELPADYTDEEVIMAVLTQLMEDFYL